MKENRCTWRGIIFFLVLFCLSGCTFDRIAAQQVKATGLWDELVMGETFGQSFVSSRDNLYKIELSTATFARVNSRLVIFRLKNSPQASTDIRSTTLLGQEIQNERPTPIVFGPIPDSAGKSYYFYIESPEATLGNAITVYSNDHNQYIEGSAYRNHQVVNGDLAFTAYSRETFTFSGILRNLISQAAQDLSFFLCYGSLILVVCVSLILSIRWRAAKGINQENEL